MKRIGGAIVAIIVAASAYAFNIRNDLLWVKRIGGAIVAIIVAASAYAFNMLIEMNASLAAHEVGFRRLIRSAHRIRTSPGHRPGT